MNIRPSGVNPIKIIMKLQTCAGKLPSLFFLQKTVKVIWLSWTLILLICREKMLKLREELLAVEEDRLQGRDGCSLDELDAYLDDVMAGL